MYFGCDLSELLFGFEMTKQIADDSRDISHDDDYVDQVSVPTADSSLGEGGVVSS